MSITDKEKSNRLPALLYRPIQALMVLMAKQKTQARSKTATASFDGVYLFKLAFYLLLGSIWIKLSAGTSLSVPIPIGLAVGLIFTAHEHFRIDRKIEYAVMLVAMLFGYFAPYGLYINV